MHRILRYGCKQEENKNKTLKCEKKPMKFVIKIFAVFLYSSAKLPLNRSSKTLDYVFRYHPFNQLGRWVGFR